MGSSLGRCLLPLLLEAFHMSLLFPSITTSAMSVGSRSIMSLKLSEPPSKSVPIMVSSSLDIPEDDLRVRLFEEPRWEVGREEPLASRLSRDGKFPPEPRREDCPCFD